MDNGVVFNRIPQTIEKLRRAGSQLVRAGAFKVEANAKQMAPVDTGFLRNSIYTVTDQGSNNSHPRPSRPGAELFPDVGSSGSPMRALVLVGASYGLFLERGTIHMSAQPFMLPAALRAQPEYTAAWQRLEAMLAL